jgi:hypothetical protein
MDEHRHQHRAPLILYLDVFDNDNGRLMGYLGDISRDGLMFISRERVPLQQQFNLRIEVPELEGEPEQMLYLSAETRWYKPNINPEWECIGCHIVSITSDHMRLLDKIVAHLCFGEDVEVHRVARS